MFSVYAIDYDQRWHHVVTTPKIVTALYEATRQLGRSLRVRVWSGWSGSWIW